MRDLVRYWKDTPPVHVMLQMLFWRVGQFAGVKGEGPKERSGAIAPTTEAELRALVASVNGG